MTNNRHQQHLASIQLIAQLINDATDELYIKVYDAREDIDAAVTWQDIADALGVTRQAAWERFTQSALRDKVWPLQKERLFD